VTNVAASGDPAHAAMPVFHRIASLLKRWLLGTPQGAVGHEQLDFYLDELTFRSTVAECATADCCSTGCSRRRWRPTRHPFVDLIADSAAQSVTI